MDNSKLENGTNTGVIVAEPQFSDYIAGVETAIVFEERIADGDWEKYKPTDEWQRRITAAKLGYDTHSCVTFSALNCVEIQIKYLLETGAFTELERDILAEYMDEEGNVNFNDWFTAVMSGTTENGNSLANVWDSIRNHGLLPEKDGYKVNDFTTREEYLSTKPTEEQKAKALKIKEVINVAYEWVPTSEKAKHLKHAPLHILTPTCGSWNTKPPKLVTDCGVKTVNHATACIGLTDEYVKDLDHYNPFVKHLALDYYIPYVVKGVVTPVKEATETVDEWTTFTYVFKKKLTYGYPASNEVKMLQMALQKLGYMKKGVFGQFGPQTKAALALFQKDNKIKDDGTNFGPITRAAMNAKLA